MRHSFIRNAEHVSYMTCFNHLANNLDRNLNMNKASSVVVVLFDNDYLNRLVKGI